MRREKVITTADLFIMGMWKAQEECAVQACVVGIEAKTEENRGTKKIANARNL